MSSSSIGTLNSNAGSNAGSDSFDPATTDGLGFLGFVRAVHWASGINRRDDADLSQLAIDPQAGSDAQLWSGLKQAKATIFVLIDGLGDHQLKELLPSGVLCSHRRGSMHAVFPSTTAAAVTTWFTAQAPAEHGLTGWHIRMARSGKVVAPLPGWERGNRRPLEGSAAERNLFTSPSAFADCASNASPKVALVQPAELLNSNYTRHHAAGAVRVGFQTLGEMVARIADLLRAGQSHLIYAYWPRFDSLSHMHGWQSAPAHDELRRCDRAMSQLFEMASGMGAAVVVSADHGFIDSSDDRCIWLDEHPDLESMLQSSLCGEPRTAHCYVKADCEEKFAAYVHEHLAYACELHRSSALVERGWYDGGLTRNPSDGARPIDSLQRTGTYTLVMKDNYIIRDRVVNERPHRLVGVHGGTSSIEMRVPLIAALPS